MSDSDDDCPTLVSARVPVTILTGFLGSGKTTLLHYILTEQHHLKICVVVNEFEFGKTIEKGLTVKSSEKTDDEWLELTNGCMCCTAKDQSVMALEAMIQKKGTFDLVLVETSGMADPGPVASMFWQDDALNGTLYLSGIVTVVDTFHIAKYLVSAEYPEASRQLLLSDRVVFNKIDLVDDATREKAIALVDDINPVAEKTFTSFAKIEDLQSILFVDTTNDHSQLAAKLPPTHTHSKLTSASIEISNLGSDGTPDPTYTMKTARDIDFLCRALLYHEGAESFEVLRIKAAIWTADGALQQLQGIGEMFDVKEMAGHSVPHGVSRFLILGRNLEQERLTEIIKGYFASKTE